MESINKILQLELTNTCSGKCEWCPYSKMNRQIGYIKTDLVEKIAQKISSRQKFVYLHFFGESAFHPKIKKIVEIFNQFGIDCGIYINARNLFKKEIIDNLIESNFNEICITINYVSELKNLELFIDKINKKIKLSFIKIDLPNKFNTISKVDFFRFVNKIKDKRNVEGRIAKYEDDNICEGKKDCCRKDENGICDLRKDNQYIVLWDGKVTTCLKDYDGKMQIGNIDNLDNYHYENKYCPFIK